MKRRTKARERKDISWYVLCPSCRSRINLDECPIPGGMTYNVEYCYECGAEIEIYPPDEKQGGEKLRIIIRLLLRIYYYLRCSYKIWEVRHLQEYTLVYTTKENVQIGVYLGRKPESPYDFIVKFREPGKQERTPAHVHLIVEMCVKHTHNPLFTLKLKEHILTMLKTINSVSSFPSTLQFFKPEHIELFKELDRVGEFTIEFLFVVTELLAIQEKTNYPEGSLTESLYKDFGVKDRFSVIQKAVLKRLR